MDLGGTANIIGEGWDRIPAACTIILKFKSYSKKLYVEICLFKAYTAGAQHCTKCFMIFISGIYLSQPSCVLNHVIGAWKG